MGKLLREVVVYRENKEKNERFDVSLVHALKQKLKNLHERVACEV